MVWVPSGNYLTTSVVLRSNVNLHLDAGSALYASRRVSDYKNHKIKVGASDAEAVEVILIALNENNISVTGTGKCIVKQCVNNLEENLNWLSQTL